MSALKVFGASIGYLRKHMVDAYGSRVLGIDDVDVKWVLTVPAIWDEAAKQFMREAAELVRIKTYYILIITKKTFSFKLPMALFYLYDAFYASDMFPKCAIF